MAKHSTSDANHDKTTTYDQRSRTAVDAAKLKNKLIADGKVQKSE